FPLVQPGCKDGRRKFYFQTMQYNFFLKIFPRKRNASVCCWFLTTYGNITRKKLPQIKLKRILPSEQLGSRNHCSRAPACFPRLTSKNNQYEKCSIFRRIGTNRSPPSVNHQKLSGYVPSRRRQEK